MVAVIHHPHDKFFKMAMEEPRVAHEFCLAHLPQTLVRKVNLHLLKIEKTSFLDGSYQASAADVLYKVPFKNDSAHLYILCEHQTGIDPFMAFRILIYQVRIMERHLKQYPNQALPLIYPLIVYSGASPWMKPLDLFALFGKQAPLARKWFKAPAKLLDLQKLSDENIKQRPWAGLMEFTLKHRKLNFEIFLEQLLPWIRHIEKTGNNGFYLASSVVKYIINGMDVHKVRVFRQKIEQLSETGDYMTTLAQEFTRVGMEKGIKQGIEQGELQGQAKLFLHQVKRRFHTVPGHYLAQIKQADTQSLLLWGEKILDAKTIEEIFATTD